jgi:Antibiotic biosynthesis monooxygenase.
MFTRLVEIQTKSGKARELTATVNEKVLPILKRQTGFVDEITLVSSNNPDRILALSFWQSEGDAERYSQEQFSTVTQIVNPYIQSQPTVETFNVDTSTVHKIAKGKAA